MLKVKTFVILVFIYLISFIAIRSDINIFYPFYLLKDVIFYPVSAISSQEDVSTTIEEGINNALEKELEELKTINDLSNTLTEFDSVKAVVIERNMMYWFNTITINKGTTSGLKEDMAVVSSKGLIGKISKVTKTTSEIKLITTSDINNKISVLVKVNDDNIYGIMTGYDKDKNLLEITGMNKLNDIPEESLVYTTGMGGVFPSGILIGKVKEITSDKYDVAKIIKVEPASDFNDFRFVNVLVRKDT